MDTKDPQLQHPNPDTMLHPEDLEPVEGYKQSYNDEVSWDEIVDDNVLLNPDADSMEGRG